MENEGFKGLRVVGLIGLMKRERVDCHHTLVTMNNAINTRNTINSINKN